MKRIVVIGGGLCGMLSALKLSERFDNVVLIEKETELGGLASCFNYKEYWIPKHYHHVLPDYTHTIRYLKEFGLYNNKWIKLKMGICADGRIWDLSGALDLMKLDFLPIIDRIRYGIFGFWAFYLLNPEKVRDDIDAKSWLEKKVGKGVLEKIFIPLYEKNKFCYPLNRLSAKQLAYRLKSREARNKYTFPEGGWHNFISCLEKKLETQGCEIIRESAVEKLDLNNKEIKIDNGNKFIFECAISTIPIPILLSITKGLPTTYFERFSKLKFISAVDLVFITEETLTEHYWLNIFEDYGGTFIQYSNLYDEYPFKVNYFCRYGVSETEFYLPNDLIYEKYIKILKKYFPEINIIVYKVFKEKYAELIYDVETIKNIPKFNEVVKDVYLGGGISAYYPIPRNTNSAIYIGEKIAEEVIKRLEK